MLLLNIQSVVTSVAGEIFNKEELKFNVEDYITKIKGLESPTVDVKSFDSGVIKTAEDMPGCCLLGYDLDTKEIVSKEDITTANSFDINDLKSKNLIFCIVQSENNKITKRTPMISGTIKNNSYGFSIYETGKTKFFTTEVTVIISLTAVLLLILGFLIIRKSRRGKKSTPAPVETVCTVSVQSAAPSVKEEPVVVVKENNNLTLEEEKDSNSVTEEEKNRALAMDEKFKEV